MVSQGGRRGTERGAQRAGVMAKGGVGFVARLGVEPGPRLGGPPALPGERVARRQVEPQPAPERLEELGQRRDTVQVWIDEQAPDGLAVGFEEGMNGRQRRGGKATVLGEVVARFERGELARGARRRERSPQAALER